MVTIKLGKYEAKIQDGVWTSDKQVIADSLNAMVDPLGPSPSDPNPDITIATKATTALGFGEITQQDVYTRTDDLVY